MVWYDRVWNGMAWYGMVWYGMVWYGMVWYGMVWYGMVWCGVVWCGMIWYGMHGMVWYGMVWYGMVWYGMVWYGMAWHGMAWYGMVWYGMACYGMLWYVMVWYTYLIPSKWIRTNKIGGIGFRFTLSLIEHGIGDHCCHQDTHAARQPLNTRECALWRTVDDRHPQVSIAQPTFCLRVKQMMKIGKLFVAGDRQKSLNL